MKTIRLLIINLAFVSYAQFCSANINIFGFGHALYDKLFKIEDDEKFHEIIEGFDIKKGDASLVDAGGVALLEERLGAFEPHECAGGSMANTIVGIARFANDNIDIHFVGAVANDEYGIKFSDDMKENGIHTTINVADSAEGAITGVVHSLITSDDRTMLTHIGMANELKSNHVTEVLMNLTMCNGKKFVLAEGYMWFNNHVASIGRDALMFAKQHAMTTVFTLASPFTVTQFRDKYLDLLPYIDILSGNEEEYYELFQTKNLEDIVTTIKGHTILVSIITLKERGAVIITPDEQIHVPVTECIEKPLDPTGAGDNWLSAFLYAYANEYPLEKCGALANLYAAKVISCYGARCSKEDAREVLEHVLEAVC